MQETVFRIRQQKVFSFRGSGNELYNLFAAKEPSFNGVLKAFDTHNSISANFEMGDKGVERVSKREVRVHCLLASGSAIAHLMVGQGILICVTDIPNEHPALSVLHAAVTRVIDRAGM